MPEYSNGLISNIRRMSNVQRSTSLTNVAINTSDMIRTQTDAAKC